MSEEIALRTTAIQRIVFADYLRLNDKVCSAATSAVTEDAGTGNWEIACAGDRDYAVYLSPGNDANTISEEIAPDETEVVPDVVPPPSTGGKDKGSGPTRGKDKG